jgi:nucleotide-binding universal stress UspA family protein
MFQHVVVPIDGSDAAWRTVPIAARMAAAVDGKLDVVTVVDRIANVTTAENDLRAGLELVGALPVTPNLQVLASDSIAEAIRRHVEQLNGAIVVMSSHGHGRSAAVLGSITDDVLRQLYGPIVVVGPHVGEDAGRLDGRYVVPLDGSHHGDAILSIAGPWTVEFGAEPWLVEAAAPGVVSTNDIMESAYPARRAHEMGKQIGREVEYEVVHGDDPARALVEFAKGMNATLIFASTHGRTGVARLRAGSVAAHIVKHAHCPVVLYRPPQLADE